ncbi:NAD(P)H-binding protein [Exiguobacterium mexicanum]|uniref:NAD(P)H-binding protein n=1 Tax=Exiguobacterium mexicanum TaxID=340146 RepID=UPI0037BFECB1
MKVLVIGATGKIGRRVLKSLAKTHQVTALIRYPELQAEYEKMGARVLTVDVEKELDKGIHDATSGQDAVIIAATAGADGSSKEIELLDRNVAMKAIDAAKKNVSVTSSCSALMAPINRTLHQKNISTSCRQTMQPTSISNIAV